MKKISKRLLYLLALVFAIITIILLIQVYAKYKKTASGTTTLTIASWNIIVNNQSIKENQDISNVIEPVFPGNENIASGVIAPTAEGYFDLVFDFSDVDVSFSYTISVSSAEESSVSDLVLTGYSVDDGEVVSTSSDISDTILYSDDIDNRTVRVYIMWDDDSSSATMDNQEDTSTTYSTSDPALLNVSIQFTQVAD